MADYISREALIQRFNRNLNACNKGTFCELCYRDVICTVEYFPAAEVEPVRHGRWVALDDEFEESDDQDEALRWGCSACHEVVEYDDWTHRSGLTKFCPHCGAKMDGGADNGK